ncbi:Serine/threonine protein kinase [Gracilaria domingensis]|nr:Serine/threonine protein kinase [Gracilaria domingensis]
MDCAPAGDMFGEVAAAGNLPPRLIRRRLRDICEALKYLHSTNIAHLDVKLENVVIAKSSKAQLIDFGCARRIDERRDPSQPVPLAGTLHYLCPELLRNAALPPAASSDAWSLGVLAYTAVAGMYPFNGARRGYTEEQTDAATRRRILEAQPHRIPSCVDVPSDLRSIIDGLLEKDVSKRMTIPQVIQILDKSMASNVIQRRPQLPIQPQQQQQAQKCDIDRPPSPATPVDADFSESSTIQTVDEAMYVIEDVQNNRLRPVAHFGRHHFPNRAHDRIQISDRTN